MPKDSAVSCAKMTEQIQMSFELWTWVGVHVQHLANTIEPSMFGGPNEVAVMRLYVKLL